MIKPLNHHYSFENPASVYDEEAMTALELAGRTAKKVSEVVNHVNDFTENMDTKHKQLVESVPGIVADDVQKHIDNGEFDAQLDAHMGYMDERLDNLILNGSENTAEVVDIRVGAQGYTYDTAGNSVRGQTEQAIMCASGLYKLTAGSINAEDGAFYYPVTNRVVSTLISVNQLAYIVGNTPAGYKYQIRLFYYGKNLEYMGYSAWALRHVMERVPANVHYIRFVVARSDDADITTDEATSNITVRTMAELEKAGYKAVTDIPFIKGSVNGSGKIVHYENRLLSPLMRKDSISHVVPKMDDEGSYFVMFACYDANMEWVDNIAFTYEAYFNFDLVGEYVRMVIRYTDNVDLTEDPVHRVTLYARDTAMLDEWNKNAPAFIYDVLDIAYSEVHMGPINTADHFMNASHMGFNALKGDVRILADDALIMSHDAGVTWDGEFIGAFDSSNYSPWVNMTEDEVLSLEYSEMDAMGNTCPVCSFREYIRICAERHKIAYITLRDVKIPELVREVVNIVRAYNMENRCVINSYTLRTLEVVRTYSRTIPVSLVLEHQTPATLNDVTRVRALGNGVLTLFYYPDSVTGLSMMQNNEAVLRTARQGGVILHMAQVNTHTDYIQCVYRGIRGFHLTKCFLPYATHNYGMKITVSGGNATVAEFSANVPKSFIAGAFGVPNTETDSVITFYDTELVRFLKTLPATVTVHSFANTTANAFIEPDEGFLILVHGGVDGEYLVTINV